MVAAGNLNFNGQLTVTVLVHIFYLKARPLDGGGTGTNATILG